MGIQKTLNRALACIVTCCYVGYLPGAPGTYASVLGCILIYFFPSIFSNIFFCVGLVLFSVLCVNLFRYDGEDPGYIVIDELAGICVTMAGQNITPMNHDHWFCSLQDFRHRQAFPDKTGGTSEGRLRYCCRRCHRGNFRECYSYYSGTVPMKLEKKIGKILQERVPHLRARGVLYRGSSGKQDYRCTRDLPAYFMAGLVTYSNEAKTKFLSVPDEIIARHGAVSNIVAERMAKGVRAAAGVDIGLSITGIAGTGRRKPRETCRHCLYGPRNKERGICVESSSSAATGAKCASSSSEEALSMLLDYLEGRLA